MGGDLMPGEVRRWDASAIQQVFRVVKNRDGTYKDFGDTMSSTQQQLSDWGGEAGETFHQEMGHKRQHIDMQGRIAPGIVAAVEQAETDANACRAELASITEEAAKYKWEIPDDAWFVDYVHNPNDPDGVLHDLEHRLAALKTKATDADHELAVAMRAAVGEVQLDSHGHEVPAQQPAPGQPPPSNAGPPVISEEALGRAMPKLAADPQKLHEYYKMLCDTMRQDGIDDPKAQIAFLATLAEESDQFTAKNLEEAWDDRYGASPPYDARAHYYQMQDGLEGDDWVYHGRGYIQLTSRGNYQAAQDYLREHGYPNIDLMGNPDQASDPKVASAIAGWYWKSHGGDLSDVAASGDPSVAFTKVTMAVNGAPNGEVVPTAHYDVRAGYYNALVAEYRAMLSAQGVPADALPTPIDTAPRY